jgi:hypothetical protein
MREGPIIIVDDHTSDQKTIARVFEELGVANEIIIFDTCEAAFTFLKQTLQSPFLILLMSTLPFRSQYHYNYSNKKQPEN